MTAIIVRLLLSMIVMLGAPVLYTAIFVGYLELRIGGRYSDDAAFAWATVVSGAYLVATWTAVWRGMVTWTALRTGLTFAALGAALLVGGATFAAFAAVRAEEAGIVIGGMIGALVWLAGSTLVWRESRRERAARHRGLGVDALPCPACGYNLTGLREATCPECGARYTLDQLYAGAVEAKRELDG